MPVTQVKLFGGSPTSDEEASPNVRAGASTPSSSPTFSSRGKPKKSIEPLLLPPSPYRTPTEPSLAGKASRAASLNDADGIECV